LTGCTDANAINFTPGAVIDDGSCVVPTCAPTTPTNVTYCYGNNENSQVIYTATAGNQVIISFNSGALESCCDDLNIYDGIGTGGTLIGTYTGDLSGLVVQSTTGAITIQVISDSSVSCSSGSLCCSAGFDYDVYCGSVAVLGCTDAGASNYDPAATVDDGSCVFCNDNLVDVVIVNGDFPGEMSWSIVDGASNVVASGNGNSADLTLCLPTGCYSVDMADSFGDGWNGGAIEFYVGGSLIASVDVDNAVIGDGESTGTDFVDIGNSGSCPVLGCTLVGACNYDPAATLDDGSCIAGPCVNDLPALAYAIPVNNLGVCAGVSGDMNEATVASPEATYRTSALDLWYTFVPSTSGVRVEFNTVDFDALIELQDASNNPIDIEDVVFVNGGEVLNIGNLTAGQTYYLRVAPWNPTSAPAPFDLCVQSIPDTRCDYGSGPYSLCNLFKADWVLADDYLFYFTSQTTGMTYTYQSGTGSSFLVLSNVSGLTWDDTYDVEISAIWDLNDGNGDAETIEVLNDEPCFIIVNPAPLAQMRPSDNQANYGPHYLGDYIAATPFVCGVIDWTWEFVNTDGSQLPIVQSRGIANAFIRLNTITGLVPGAVYEVRVRPEFNGYSGNYGPVQLLSIIGPVNQEANVAPVVLEDAAERVVAGDITETALYPNPNSGELVNLNINNIPSDVERITVDIYNGVGALVVSQQIAVSGVNMQSTMSLNELAGGIYTVNINVGNEVRTERLIIQK
jgi:hypothetical protein